MLEAIADGEPIQKMRLPNGKESETLISASARERIHAVDILGKYGMTVGSLDEEELQQRLYRTVERITALADPETAETLLRALDRIWDPHQDQYQAEHQPIAAAYRRAGFRA